MKTLLRLEEFGKFTLAFFLFSQLYERWWLFFALLLTPDISMMGYAFGKKTGAASYNLFHHKGVATLCIVCGLFFQSDYLLGAGIILFGHSAMDRMFGYGLKFADDFKHTHLGWIGNTNPSK